MTTTETLPVKYAAQDDEGNIVYEVTETPLRGGGRRDLQVHTPRKRDAIAQTSIVDHLRRFFAAIDMEASRYKDDPATNVQALAKVEAMLADLRYVRDMLHKYVADALADQHIRRLTVDGVITVEGTTDAKRTDWQHEQLLADLLKRAALVVTSTDTGEILTPVEASRLLLTWFRPEWRLTPIRDLDIDPDYYCTLPTDDETGKVVRTPTLKIVDNQERRTTT